eukprot:sb/3477820/
MASYCPITLEEDDHVYRVLERRPWYTRSGWIRYQQHTTNIPSSSVVPKVHPGEVILAAHSYCILGYYTFQYLFTFLMFITSSNKFFPYLCNDHSFIRKGEIELGM